MSSLLGDRKACGAQVELYRRTPNGPEVCAYSSARSTRFIGDALDFWQGRLKEADG